MEFWDESQQLKGKKLNHPFIGCLHMTSTVLSIIFFNYYNNLMMYILSSPFFIHEELKQREVM